MRSNAGPGHPWTGGMVIAVALLVGTPAAFAQHVHPPHTPPAAPAAETASPSAAPTFPDVRLVDQDGRDVRFYQDLVKGRVVAINAIFTTCTTICPPMGATFGSLQKRLGPDAGRAHLISISIDPNRDTPARLKAWAARFDARPGWTLVTGAKPDVDRLLKALGLFAASPWEHAPVTLVGNDATGEWTRTYGLTPGTRLAGILDRWLDPSSASAARGQK